MVYQNHSDEFDFWQGDFAPDGSPHPNVDDYQYQLFNPLATAGAQAGPTLSGTINNERQSDLSGTSSPSLLLASDYELHFGVPPPHQAAQPPLPSLNFEDIVDLLAFVPDGPQPQGPDAPAPEQSASSRPMGSGPVQIPTSYPGHANNAPLGGLSMSASVPDNLFGSQTPMYPEANRARSRSYAGPTQTPYHHAIPPLAFHTPPTLGLNGTFQVAFQEMAHSPPTISMSPPTGPTQHVLHFDLDGHAHDHSELPPTIQPSSIPLPASPSDESSFASSPTLSPATSTSSLAGPPSPNTSRSETFKWRLNSRDDQGWRCMCVSKAKKRRRHLESCPNNPNKPRITCPLCPQPFIGGSRKSALSKHLSNIHGHKSDRKKKDKRR